MTVPFAGGATPRACGSPRRTPLEAWVFARAGADDLDGLRAHQLDALRASLDRARRLSPFYAERLVDLRPGELRSLDDLARLPLTSGDDIRAQGMRMLCVLILLPGERPGSVGDLLRRGLERLGVEGVVYGPVADPAPALRVLHAGHFDCVVGIPVQVLGLARRDAASGAPASLESVLLSTDQAPRSLVAVLERLWGCRVFDHYGTTEMGLGGGVECEALDGCHLREADLLFEVADPETGLPMPDGEYGEVVFTTLTREAMPLVRYRTGDRGRFLAEPCPCGTPLRRLERVRARYCGRAHLRGGGFVDQAAVDEPLFALSQVIDVRAGLRREGDLDVLDVEVLAPGAGPALLKAAAAGLEAAPALAGAVSAGRLRVEVMVTPTPWPQGVGTAKRTLVESDETLEATT